MYYEITTRHTFVNEKGRELKLSASYIADCELFAEAEYKAMSEASAVSSDGEAEVIAIKRSKVRDIVCSNKSNTSYIATITATYLQDDGSAKEMKYNVLIFADDIDGAKVQSAEYMKQGLEDMRLDAIAKSKIIKVLP